MVAAFGGNEREVVMRLALTLLVLTLLCSTSARANDLTPDQQEEVKLKSGKWMEQRQKAEAFEKSGRFAEAESLWKEMLADRQALGLDLLSEYDGLAALYQHWGKKDQAVKTYEEMVAQREKDAGPDDPTVIYPLKQLAACLKKVGKESEAKKVLARAAAIDKNSQTIPTFPKITLAPKSPERIAEAKKMRELGEKMMKRDLQAKAQAYFEQAVALEPDNPENLYDRAEAYQWFNKFTKAKADLDKAIKLKPDFQKAYVLRAYVDMNMNQHKVAIADFEKAIELDPKDAESMGTRAKLLDGMGQHKAAIDGFTKIIETNDKLYWPYIQRAELYKNIKDYKAAIADLTVLVNRQPADPDFYEYRAVNYVKAGDLKNALADYNKLIELNPKYSVGYHERAKIYEKIEGAKSKKALADFAMAKKLGYN